MKEDGRGCREGWCREGWTALGDSQAVYLPTPGSWLASSLAVVGIRPPISMTTCNTSHINTTPKQRAKDLFNITVHKQANMLKNKQR